MTIKQFITIVAIAMYVAVIINHTSQVQYECLVSPDNYDTFDNFKLPLTGRPIQYKVFIETYLPNPGFSGVVEIEVLMESEEIEVSNIKGSYKSKYGFEVDNSKELLYINFGHFLNPINNTLKIHFNGSYDNSGVGFFWDNFTREDGTISYFAATNFEESYARRAFPCFDEPNFKAMFQISLKYGFDYQSFTSMKSLNTWHAGGKYVEDFEQSDFISTYQLAFVIAEFSRISSFDLTNSPNYRMYGRPEAIRKGEPNYAFDSVPLIYTAVESYANVSSDLEYMLLFVIPHFRRKSSESGIILMYSESVLMPSDSLKSALQKKQQVYLDVSFGVVQYLFGNIVSPNTWKYGWLVDGLAAFLSYQIAHKVEPEWRLDEQFVERMWYCLEFESKTPIYITGQWDNPNTTDNHNIVHLKAGLIMRMLQHVVTAEIFREGLTNYLNTDRNTNAAKSANIYFNIQASVNRRMRNWLPYNREVCNVMTTWETEAGYPVVNFIRNYTENSMTITQQKFYMDGRHLDDTGNWHVPITWTTELETNFKNTEPKMWLYPQSYRTEKSIVAKDRWIIANIQATGYYRVNYDETNWKLIADSLNTPYYTLIHPVNRAQLIDDAFNLARSGRLSYTIAFSLLNYMHQEFDYIVHLAYFRVLKFIDKVASWSNSYGVFEQFVGTTFTFAFNRMGIDESGNHNDHVHNIQRKEIIHWACLMNNSDCRTITTQYLRSFNMTNRFEFTIVCAGLRGSSEEEWFRIENLINNQTDKEIRTVYKSALGCSENPKTLQHYLDREVKLKNSDVFENIYSKGNYGRIFVLNYILTNFETIEANIGDDLGKVLLDFAKHLSIDDHVYLFNSFNRRASRPNVRKFIDIAIPIIQGNINLTWVDWFHVSEAITRIYNTPSK